MSKLAIVILNWNGKKHLGDFLPSVFAHSPEADEIVVVDNASSDGSASFLRENFPKAKVVHNPENGGFAKGYNDGLSQISSEYFLLLNSDVEVTPGWIGPLLDLLESDKSIAACQPKVMAFRNKNLFEHAGASGGFIDRFAYPFCRGRIFNHNERDEGQYDELKEVFWATGACMLVRSSSFWEVGGFDKDFFAHMEEIDLCWRMKNLGYRIFAEPKSTVYHLGGGTLSYSSPKKTFLNFRNSLFTLYKNSGAKFLLLTLLMRMAIDGLAGARFLTEGKGKHFLAVFKAHMSFYRQLPKLRAKRRALMRKEKLTGLYDGCIVVDFYLKGRKKFSSLGL